MTDLTTRLTLYRARHDLNKKQLGAMVGVTGSTICKWESGRNKPSYANLKRIEALFEDDKITDLNTIYLDDLDYQIARAQADLGSLLPGRIHWCDDLDGQLGMTLPEPIVLERDEPARDWRSWALIFLAAVLLGVLLTFTMEALA